MKLEWKSCLRVAACVFLLYLRIYYWSTVSAFLSTLLGALLPILIGFAIAYVLNILMGFYERHYFPKLAERPFVNKSRRAVCLLAAVLTLLAIIALVIWIVVPRLVSCVKFLVAEIPPVIEQLLTSEAVARLIPKDILSDLSNIKWDEIVSNAARFLASGIGSAADAVFSVISSTVSTVTTAFIGIIFAIYMLLGKEKLSGQVNRLIHSYLPKAEAGLRYVGSSLNDSFRKYIVGQCTEAVVLGLLCTAGMFLFGFPYAAMIGALIGFTALIPVAGAYIGAVFGALMILTVSPVKALLFIVFIIVLQQLEGNLIYPRVVGKTIGLPAIWVLAAVTVGGSLMGIFGMLIGVPITSCIYRIIREDIFKRERDKFTKN